MPPTHSHTVCAQGGSIWINQKLTTPLTNNSQYDYEGNIMTLQAKPCIVRYGELKPCKTAFIDAHTPGSDQKENFTIIGGGVSESADQHVHIRETPGFNIGAAGQPPRCRNSLHDHNTAEAFFVLKGRWRFFWGRYGDAGEVTLEEGDIFNIPTGIFRGFENVGTDYGMIMALLGGDDAGGGVLWAPQVVEDAADHGLILGENGVLYDSKKGETPPHNVSPMPLMSAEELAKRGEPTTADVVPNYVARYWDLMALADRQPIGVIGKDAILRDRPGFEADFITRGSISSDRYTCDVAEVLMPVKGHWRLEWDGGEDALAPGDTCLVPEGMARSIEPSMTGEASMYRVRRTDDPAGKTMPLD
jgi:quercetin dioxygenase-like cupin family protein